MLMQTKSTMQLEALLSGYGRLGPCRKISIKESPKGLTCAKEALSPFSMRFRFYNVHLNFYLYLSMACLCKFMQGQSVCARRSVHRKNSQMDKQQRPSIHELPSPDILVLGDHILAIIQLSPSSHSSLNAYAMSSPTTSVNATRKMNINCETPCRNTGSEAVCILTGSIATTTYAC